LRSAAWAPVARLADAASNMARDKDLVITVSLLMDVYQ
jgi:hypothetical protein